MSGVSTFDDYAGNVFILHIGNQSSKRVDIVCDIYVPESLKESTRKKRGKGTGVSDSANKKELFAFLSAKVAELDWPEEKTVYMNSGICKRCKPFSSIV